MSTKNYELFKKNPLEWDLENDGVSTNNEINLKTIRYELETFVCAGEYKQGLERILKTYISRFGKEQAGAWVSGFYGSGKSHLVKVLRFLWTDEKFDDSNTPRSIAHLPDSIIELLKELSTIGKREGWLHAAGGTLKAGKGDIRARVLGIIFLSVGLPEDLNIARLILDLREDGTLEEIQKQMQSAGGNPDPKSWRIYSEQKFLQAYLATHSHLGSTTQEIAKALQSQYPAKTGEISIKEMLELIRKALTKDGKLPCTVLVLDEVQQFIGDDSNKANDIQEVAEAIQKELDGKFLIVGTGQSALNATPALAKLMGRFTVKTHLSDNDVERVVRTVVLQKKPEKKQEIETLVSQNLGEISRQLNSTKIATCNEDREAYAQDYPLLPVRRRFWEHVLHGIDTTGTAAQMRTQLRVTHDACRDIANFPIGTVITGDYIYEQIATELLQTNVLPKKFQEQIDEQKKKEHGNLRSRICSLVFLINKLPRQGGDIGVRANAEHISDLLTGDFSANCTEVRKMVPTLLNALADEGVLMVVDDEYRLQTPEGQAWESEYKSAFAAIRNTDSRIAAERNRVLGQTIQDELGKISIPHGAARETRKISIHHGTSNPPVSDGLTVWVRDGFTENESSIIQDIQQRHVNDPVVHVLIPKIKSDELKNALAGSLAAEQTISAKGNPTTSEGIEAKSSMSSRYAAEKSKLDSCIHEIFQGARIFLSGGAQQPSTPLKDGVINACIASLANLYPQFSAADSANWPTVWKQAKQGGGSALAAVGYNGDPDKHAVTAELFRAIGGNWKKGSELYNTYTAPPYGWPKESLDASLAVLLQSGHITARLSNQPASLDGLDQRKISQAEYKQQNPILTAAEKLRVKKLFQELGTPFKPGQEEIAASEFVRGLRELAVKAGGEAPAPDQPQPAILQVLAGLQGNELLHALHADSDQISSFITDWKELAKQVHERLPKYRIATELLQQAEAANLSDAQQARTSLDAIIANRALLDNPDPVLSVTTTLRTALRAALSGAVQQYDQTYQSELAKLGHQTIWSALPEQKKASFLQSAGVYSLKLPDTGSDEQLLQALRSKKISDYQLEIAALPSRCHKAFEAAAQEAAPKARRVTLPAAQIANAEDLETWLSKTKEVIEKALKDGPAIV